MKTILLLSILLSAITLPATGELTVEDIEKIDAKIQASETRIREDFGEKIQATVEDIEKIDAKIQASENSSVRDSNKRRFRRKNSGSRQAYKLEFQLDKVFSNHYCCHRRYTTDNRCLA